MTTGKGEDDALVRLLVEIRPVADAARQAADVDEVEGALRVGPFCGGVVDFEADVGRGGGGLDGGEVGSWIPISLATISNLRFYGAICGFVGMEWGRGVPIISAEGKKSAISLSPSADALS